LEKISPPKDMLTIAEKLAAEAAASQDPGVLTAGVPVNLGCLITQNINDLPLKTHLVAIDCSLERLLQYTQRAQGTGGMEMEPELTERLHQSIATSV
jgi:flagellar biosynthesis component FlhA